MTRRSERALWIVAFAGSIVVHAALAFALALAPAQELPQPPETEIVFQPLPQAVAGEPRRSQVLAEHAPSGENTLAFAAAPEHATLASDVDIAAAPTPDRASLEIVPIERMAGAADEAVVPAAATEPTKAPPAVATGSVVTEVGGHSIASAAYTGEAAVIALDAAAVRPSVPQTFGAARVPQAPAQIADRPARAGIAAPAAEATTVAVAGQVAARGAIQPEAVLAAAGQPRAAVAQPHARAPSAALVAAAPAASPRAAVQSVPPVASAPQAVAVSVIPVVPTSPVSADPQLPIAARSPEVPLLAPSVPRQSPAQAYEALLGAIAGESGKGGCFMALASGGDEIGVDGFAAARDRLDRFSRDLGDAMELPVEMRRHAVSTSQCAALAFAGGLASYPEPALAVELESAAIGSGGEIAGMVRYIARPWFYLLVIDDAGRVQEIDRDRLTEAAPGTVAFRVPLTLLDEAPDTVQLLLAVASDEILENVWLREGEQAEIYFEDLRAEIVAGGGRVDFGIAPFMLR